MSKTERTENATGTEHSAATILHYVPTTDEPRLHCDKHCRNLQQTTAKIASTPAADADGQLCKMCAGDQSLDDLQPDSEAVATCDDCDAGIYAGTHRDWRRTPQGRRACPECGAIPADDQRDHEEELIADGGWNTTDLNEAMKRASATNGTEHYRQKAERIAKQNQFHVGLLIGIAIGALWEAIRR